MIGYRLSRTELVALVDAFAPDWRTRAAQRTASFRAAGRYDESSSIWSEVKPVYMALQGESKCAFCERKLESVEHGKGEQDVEHFRPKKRTLPWPLPASLHAAGVTPTALPTGSAGYHLLPYDLFNYTAACKPCNSSLKRDYFPIAGTPAHGGDSPEQMAAGELPLLIYPIGDFDADPETLIGFIGASPVALPVDGHARDRALTTIEFFRLDDVGARKNLFRERAIVITALYPQLEIRRAGTEAAERLRKAERVIQGLQSARSQHANCARSFERIHRADPALAERIFEEAADLVASSS